MNFLKISLSTRFDSAPPLCKITCCDKTLFESVLDRNVDLEFDIGDFKKFNLEITKSGKTPELVKAKHEQIITVDRVNLNGVDLKTNELGEFSMTDNLYVEDETIQTDRLHLNGKWRLELPARELKGDVTYRLAELELRDVLRDCDIACFGCSQTYGSFLDKHETWPSRLKEITDLKVMNYGIAGSNINEITSFVDHYCENHKAGTILIYLPHTFRRQMTIDGEIKRLMPLDPENKELLMHGEEHSIAVLSGKLFEWLENISSHTRVFFGTYQTSENMIYQNTKLKKHMMPFLEGDQFPKTSDGLHHGPEFNQEFAKKLKNFLDLG